jgi:3-dehydroquinate dehydratase
MVKILLLQGANLTFLGRREPEIYGSTMPADLDAMLRCHAHNHAYQLEIFYTNIEGEAINRIYQAVDEGFDGLVMDPAGFTYSGFALKDCIKGVGLPYVEVARNPGLPFQSQPRSVYSAPTCTAPALSLGLRSETSSQLSTLSEGLFE